MSEIMGGILWGPQHPEAQKAVADLTRRVEVLERARAHAPQCPAWKLDHVGYCCGGSDPASVPEWRRLVDLAAGRMDDWMLPTPLGTVLDIFSYLEMYPRRTDDIIQLARLVAVCEDQVGDDWKADPEGGYHADSRPMCDVDCLLGAFGYSEMWRVLGSRAAAWLRDLTEGGAA